MGLVCGDLSAAAAALHNSRVVRGSHELLSGMAIVELGERVTSFIPRFEL